MGTIKSNEWYLENLKTKSINYLNIGEFRIGRSLGSDLSVETKHCSFLHCTITLNDNDDRVWLSNESRFGTYVNGISVKEMELDDGDVISLVSEETVPKEMLYRIKHMQYKLHRIANPMPSPREILVTTTTSPIVIDSSDDEEVENKTMENKFADDYEVGEPSSKCSGDPDTESRPSTPKRNDPVSRAMVEMEKKFKKMENKRKIIECSSALKIPMEPLSKIPRRIAHTPKLHPQLSTPKVCDIQTQGHSMTSPFGGATNIPEPKGQQFWLENLLTPPSVSPVDEVEINPDDAIISTIINWDAYKIFDSKYLRERFQTNVPTVPSTFSDFKNYEMCVSKFIFLYNVLLTYICMTILHVWQLKTLFYRFCRS